MIIFRTERALIRTFDKNDIDVLMEYRNDSEWMKYQGFKNKSKEEYSAILIGQSNLENGIQYAIESKKTSELIGDIYVQKENDIFWIGYTVHPKHARKGYAYEVCLGLIDYINGLGNYTIRAGVHPDNSSSIKLLEKLGFVYKSLEKSELIYQIESK